MAEWAIGAGTANLGIINKGVAVDLQKMHSANPTVLSVKR